MWFPVSGSSKESIDFTVSLEFDWRHEQRTTINEQRSTINEQRSTIALHHFKLEEDLFAAEDVAQIMLPEFAREAESLRPLIEVY
jgi:hypothetical protein